MVARGEPSNGDTRALRLIGNSPAKLDIADRVDFRVCPRSSQGAQSQVRPSRLVELRSQAKCWSEWQDLNLRPPRPERGELPDCGFRLFSSDPGARPRVWRLLPHHRQSLEGFHSDKARFGAAGNETRGAGC